MTINIRIAEAYLKGEVIEYKISTNADWIKVCPYERPSDLWRISNNNYQFRIAPKKKRYTLVMTKCSTKEIYLIHNQTFCSDTDNLLAIIDDENEVFGPYDPEYVEFCENEA